MQKILKILRLETLSELCLILLSFVLFMAKSWENSIHSVDSALHARLALEVTKNGWVPALPMPSYGALDPRPFFNDQPFTLFYFVGQWMRLLGPDAWSARFIPGLFGVATIYLLLLIGRKYFGRAVGFGAALILMLTPMFLQASARFQLDPSMTFFILLSFFFWLKRNDSGTVASVVGAVLFKAPTGLLVLPAGFLCDLLRSRGFTLSSIRRVLTISFFSILFILLFWWMVNRIAGQDLFLDYFQRQVWGTSVNGRFEDRQYDSLFFFKVFVRQLWLWILILLFGLGYRLFKRDLSFSLEEFRSEPFYLSCAMTVVLVLVVSAVRFQAVNYFMPAFPFIALILALLIQNVISRFWVWMENFVVHATPITMFALLIFPVTLGPEMMPAFRHFAPFIQTAGDCSDSVMFIDGNLYGGKNTYFCQIAFYTGRKVLPSSCDQALELIHERKPAWILLSGNDQVNCLKNQELSEYVTRIQFGSQYLWGIYPVGRSQFDLTPLLRQLEPPLDCKPKELRDSPWLRL